MNNNTQITNQCGEGLSFLQVILRERERGGERERKRWGYNVTTKNKKMPVFHFKRGGKQ